MFLSNIFFPTSLSASIFLPTSPVFLVTQIGNQFLAAEPKAVQPLNGTARVLTLKGQDHLLASIPTRNILSAAPPAPDTTFVVEDESAIILVCSVSQETRLLDDWM